MPESAKEGILAEYMAGKYLEDKGYKIVGRNLSFRGIGELDIICEDGATLVFVEVKYRKDKQFGDPLEAITKPKIRKLIKAANLYIADTNSSDRVVRFDVVCVRDGIVQHYENAFYGDFV